MKSESINQYDAFVNDDSNRIDMLLLDDDIVSDVLKDICWNTFIYPYSTEAQFNIRRLSHDTYTLWCMVLADMELYLLELFDTAKQDNDTSWKEPVYYYDTMDPYMFKWMVAIYMAWALVVVYEVDISESKKETADLPLLRKQPRYTHHYHDNSSAYFTLCKARFVLDKSVKDEQVSEHHLYTYSDVDTLFQMVMMFEIYLTGMTQHWAHFLDIYNPDTINRGFMCSSCYRVISFEDKTKYPQINIWDFPRCNCTVGRRIKDTVKDFHAPEWINIDRPIIRQIQALNFHGYYTLMCCSGHVRKDAIDADVENSRMWVSFNIEKMDSAHRDNFIAFMESKMLEECAEFTRPKNEEMLSIISTKDVRTDLPEDDWDQDTKDTMAAFVKLIDALCTDTFDREGSE